MTQKILNLIRPYVAAYIIDKPTKTEFIQLFLEMDGEERDLVTAAITNPKLEIDKDKAGAFKVPYIAGAIYIGLYLSKKTDVERQLLEEQILDKKTFGRMTDNQVAKMLNRTDNYIKQLAAALPKMDGDAKRDVLKQFVAYGTQSKVVEAEVKDEDGRVIQPAIWGMADAKVAMNAIQELNKMDNEYGEPERATSSMETHAERVRRLADDAKIISEHQRQHRDKNLKLISREVDHGRSN